MKYILWLLFDVAVRILIITPSCIIGSILAHSLGAPDFVSFGVSVLFGIITACLVSLFGWIQTER